MHISAKLKVRGSNPANTSFFYVDKIIFVRFLFLSAELRQHGNFLHIKHFHY